MQKMAAVTNDTDICEHTTPGDEIVVEPGYLRGHGTRLEGGKLVATVSGFIERVNKLISVRSLNYRYVGEVGDVVVGRITEVGDKRWRVDIQGRQDAALHLSSIILPGGAQRRRTADDALQMRNFFTEGDLVSAEIQAVHHDGSVALHTRSAKYGKLDNGQLVVVPQALVKRCKQHFLPLPNTDVMMILGNNGYIWLTRVLTENEIKVKDLFDINMDSAAEKQVLHTSAAQRQCLARVRNSIMALANIGSSIHPHSIADVFEESIRLGLDAKDMLHPRNLSSLTQLAINRSQAMHEIFGADLTVFTLYEDVVHLTRMIWGYYVNDRLGSEGEAASINLNAVREFAKKELITLLEATPGKKALVLDPYLVGPLGLIAEVALLKEHGVDKIYQLLAEPLVTDCRQIIYLVRPRTDHMTMIAEQILAFNSVKPPTGTNPAALASAAAFAALPPRTYSLYFVSRRTMLCEKVLEERGVYGDLTVVGEYPLDLIPFDVDVLSMEYDQTFRNVFVDGDPTALHAIAKALMKLQCLYGLIQTLKVKGDASLEVVRLMMRMRREAGDQEFSASGLPEIDTLILLDRTSDLITPMLSQHTYEGMLDEQFELKNNSITVESDIFGAPPPSTAAPPPSASMATPLPQPAQRKLALNSSDVLFREIRDMNVAILGPYLAKKAAYVRETYEERHKAATVTEIAEFVKKFKNLQVEHNLLQIHINLAEKLLAEMKLNSFRRRMEVEKAMLTGNLISEADSVDVEQFIEACIAKREPIQRVLRLLCLLSLTGGGLRAKKFDFWRQEILQSYGFEYAFTLQNLDKLGAIRREIVTSGGGGGSTFGGWGSGGGTGNVWPTLRTKLRLMQDEYDLKRSDDMAITYSGYCPLSVRLIEAAAKPGGWKSIEEYLTMIPGATVEYRQDLPLAVEEKTLLAAAALAAHPTQGKVSASAAVTTNTTTNSLSDQKTPVTLVFFVGGVTFAEISAIRMLQQRDRNRDYLIATTKIINGQTLVDTVIERIANDLELKPLTRR